MHEFKKKKMINAIKLGSFKELDILRMRDFLVHYLTNFLSSAYDILELFGFTDKFYSRRDPPSH